MIPRVHQNGFIQLDIGPGRRIHVWPDGPINHQKTSSPIHDHRFSFKSLVLCGVLENVEYSFSENPTGKYHLHLAKDILMPTGKHGDIYESSRVLVYPGQTYMFEWGKFHESVGHGLTATLMTKTETRSTWIPKVLCLAGQPPDNDFNREQDNDKGVLWEYIARALLQGGVGSGLHSRA